MDSNNNEQTDLLRAIWNQVKTLDKNLSGRLDQTNERVDQTNERLDGLNERLGQTNERLGQTNERVEQTNKRLDSLVKGQIETNTKLAVLAGDVRTLGGRFENFLTGEHQREHGELRLRVERLEQHTGLGPPSTE